MKKIDVENSDPEASALTKAQLAELLFDHIGLNKRESKDMVDAFFELIVQELVSGNDVKLSGFGNFQIRTKAPRPGRKVGHVNTTGDDLDATVYEARAAAAFFAD